MSFLRQKDRYSTSAILSPVCYGFIMVTVSLVYWYSFPSGTSDWKARGGGGGGYVCNRL